MSRCLAGGGTVKIKARDLIGPALDWATTFALYGEQARYVWKYASHRHRYSTDWSLGGPIIEQEGINLRAVRKPGHPFDRQWLAMRAEHSGTSEAVRWVKLAWTQSGTQERRRWQGDTALIAAMRCYVESKLGDEVDVPDELTGGCK